jgi:uroporphyrin-3 C-methyltransferase
MSAPGPETAAESSPVRAPHIAWRAWVVPVVLVVLALAFAWQWHESRSEISSLREELAKRLRDSDTDTRDARLLSRQAQEAARESQTKLAQLEAKLAESQSQQLALEALYQELSRGRDEWALAEIEQILAIASQQLQLAGNVNAALAALQTADARLARAERNQFLPLRKAMARDIEKLKAAPNADIAGMALKLDQVIASVEQLPFPSDQPDGAATRAAERREEGFWARLGSGLWNEVKGLVQVRNLERPEPPLLAPTQAYFLRENLKLRLLSARLALLERNQPLFRADMKSAEDWVSRYFDPRSKQVAGAAGLLKQLGSSGISIEIPDISESLAAVRSFKAAREKTSR